VWGGRVCDPLRVVRVCPVCAPSATRMPISHVLRVTSCASKPDCPMAASSATSPNRLARRATDRSWKCCLSMVSVCVSILLVGVNSALLGPR
jgi:hypothetical protein